MPEQESKNKSEDEKDPEVVTESKVKEIVDAALEPFKKLLSSDDSSSNDGNDDKKSGTEPDEEDNKNTRLSLRQVQARAEKMVKDEVARVFGEKEHAQEHEKIKKESEERKKTAPQPPPAKKNKLRELVLGKNWDSP